MSNVSELPTGRYDAVRTLRHSLALAEKGEITDVVIICGKRDPSNTVNPQDIWAVWSEQRRYEVLWMQRWFNSWLNKRYFGNYHGDDDGE